VTITIDAMETALAPFFTGVSGIIKYFPDFPDALQDRMLPCVITSPGAATYNETVRGAKSLRTVRRWRAIVIVKKAVLGREFQAESEVKPFLTSVPARLKAYPVVRCADGKTFELRLHQGGDNGVQPITYNKVDYVGTVIEFFTETDEYITPA
jgi:hypothetical protein